MGKRLQTVAAVGCMKTLLTLFNIVFMITGIVVLAIGIWLNTELYKYMELTSDYNNVLGYVLIGTGIVIVFVCSMACWCTMKGQSALLYTYGVFLVIVFVFELSAGISGYVYRSKVDEGFKLGIKNAMEHYTTDSDHSRSLDVLQSSLHCCGRERYDDWFETPWANGTRSVPASCCSVPAHAACKHMNLPPGANATDLFQKGCYKLVLDTMQGNLLIVGGTALGVAFFMLLGVLISCCLAKHINKAKYEQV